MKVKEGKLVSDGLELNTLEVALDHTTLLIIEGYGGFVMCGALDVEIYNSPKMIARGVICGKAIGVKTIEELYQAELAEVCQYAKAIGWEPGTRVYEAFHILSQKE